MDAGEKYTESARETLERRFRRIYREAQGDIIEKMNAHLARYKRLDAQKRAALSAGKITKEEYNLWVQGQVFAGKQWKNKLDSVATSLLYANQQANDLIEGKKRAVFGENATFQAYKLENDAEMDLSFDVYDSATVTRLIKDQPELLPRKKVKEGADKAWNREKVANCITQGIIQGESISKIAERIGRDTASMNQSAMTRYARTAMTGAQNAGRMEMLHEAKGMGINVKKKWLATLDSRTRDAHADLDGQEAEVDEPFQSQLGPIMYPGDPKANPANVWNCRCTLVYVYPEYKGGKSKRAAYKEYEDEGGNKRREYETIPDMTYKEWKAWKSNGGQIFQEVQVGPKKAGFAAASTIEQAEEYAKRFVSQYGKASYKNVDLEYANTCNRVLADIHENYDVGNLYSVQAMNTREKIWKDSTSEAAYRWGNGDLFINPRYYKTQKLFTEHKAEIDKLMDTVLKNGRQFIDSGKATGTKKEYIEALLRTGRQCVAQSHDFVEGTFVHECGHMLDDKLFRKEIASALGGTNITGAQLLAESRAKYGGGISGYAISSNQEYIAESFTAWWYGEGEKCDPVIAGIFERMMKK